MKIIRQTAQSAEIQLFLDLSHTPLRWCSYGTAGNWSLYLTQFEPGDGVYHVVLQVYTARKAPRIFASLDTVMKFVTSFENSPPIIFHHVPQVALG